MTYNKQLQQLKDNYEAARAVCATRDAAYDAARAAYDAARAARDAARAAFKAALEAEENS